MQYLIIIAVVLLLSCFYAGCKPFSGGGNAGGGEQGQTQMLPELYEPVSREQLEDRLGQLAVLPAPNQLSPGAMCYKVAAPPSRIEYVCPKCGERTLYADQQSNERGVIRFLVWELDSCRKTVKEITGVSIELDESQYCHKCSGDIEKPSLGIVVTYTETEGEHRCWGVKYDDLMLISELIQGERLHTGELDFQTPLKDHIGRLEQLLGITLETKE
ncbi:MAG: hypothetical protein KAS23_07650 [Anaerohalosphaera sp.]|nr:hypothetical protein [Anaerohalosphaera sp.]